ncbi:hypothetical protein N7522_012777 [Penicillium canescens]|nr:hypothetical protein N7522_012777 [Penicillium canescens]
MGPKESKSGREGSSRGEVVEGDMMYEDHQQQSSSMDDKAKNRNGVWYVENWYVSLTYRNNHME